MAEIHNDMHHVAFAAKTVSVFIVLKLILLFKKNLFFFCYSLQWAAPWNAETKAAAVHYLEIVLFLLFTFLLFTKHSFSLLLSQPAKLIKKFGAQ